MIALVVCRKVRWSKVARVEAFSEAPAFSKVFVIALKGLPKLKFQQESRGYDMKKASTAARKPFQHRLA
jgi:hypothetical protein